MALPYWIRRVFSRPVPGRAVPRPHPLGFLHLEDRTVPALHVDAVFAPGTPAEYINQIENTAAGENSTPTGRWTATATDGPGLQQGDPTTLRWGFVSDGTFVPGGNLGAGEAGSGSTLVAALDARFGSGPGGTDLTQRPWFHIFSDSFARISALTGITYVYEPADDGAAFITTAGSVGSRADVRIAGHAIDGADNVLAYDFYPDTSEMVIDTDDLGAGGYLSSLTNANRAFRNVLLHEHGHGLGLGHEQPVAQVALMEPFAATSFDGPQFDDVLRLQRYYGDAYEKNGGNDTLATAAPLGSVSAGGSVVIGTSGNTPTQLTGPTATDFVSIDGTSDTDYWSFSVDTATQVTVTLLPVGPTYQSGQNGEDPTTFVASAQSALKLELLDDSGTVLASLDAPAPGATVTLTDLPTPQGGTFFVRVSGTQDAAQMYQLTVTSSAYTAPGTLWLDASNNLRFDDSAGLNDTVRLQEDVGNGRYVVTTSNPVQNLVPGATQISATVVWVPFAAVTGPDVFVNTAGGDDTFTADYSLGVTGAAINFDGGTGTDALQVVGSPGSDDVTFHLLSTAGDGVLSGLGGPLTVTGVDAVAFDGGTGANSFSFADDTDTSLGTAADPAGGIVVTPHSATAAGMTVGDSLALDLSRVTSLTVNGDGTGSGSDDVITVYGVSTRGFGSAAGEQTATNGNDTIAVSDSLVTITNATLGTLLPVTLGRTGGAVTFSDLFVRGGDEGPTGGDTVTATPSALLAIRLDGGAPTASPGDRLTLAAAGTARVFADPLGGLVFEQTSGGGGAVHFANFESVPVTATGGRLEVLGDDGRTSTTNPSGSPTADTVSVVGTGSGAGRFTLDGIGGLTFTAIVDLYLATFAGDDTLALTAVSDWDLFVTLDGGTGTDELDYTGAAGVVDDLRVTGTGPRAGWFADPAVWSTKFLTDNARPGPPSGFTFAGVDTLGLTANPGDGDTLAMDLTTGGDAVTVKPAAGGAALVAVAGSYTVAATGYAGVAINGGDGNDDFTVDLNGSPLLPFALTLTGDRAGGPAFSNRLTVRGTAGVDDAFSLVPGADGRSGMVVDGASVTYTGIDAVAFDGDGGTSSDSLTVAGTTGADSFTLTGTSGGGGTIVAAGRGPVTFTGFGSGDSSVELDGLGGSDRFVVAQPTGWGLARVVLDGGATGTDTAQVTGTAGADAFVLDPAAGRLVVTAGGTVTAYDTTHISRFDLDAGDGSDSLVVTGFLTGQAAVPSGTLGGPPQVGYQNFEAVQVGQVPAAVGDTATTAEDTPVGVVVLANDAGLTDGPVAVTITNYPSHGSVVVNPDRTVTYTPDRDYSGPDSFTYQVTDANGEGSAALVALTVTPVNDAPVPTVRGVLSTTESTPLAVIGVRATDVDSDTLSVTIRADNGTLALGPAAGVTVTGSGSASLTMTGPIATLNAALTGLSYTPAPGFYGTDTLTVMASDGALTGTTSVPVDVRADPARHRFVVGAMTGGGPAVKTYTAAGDTQASFFAYDPSFRGGVHVATGDINGDGVPDVVTGAGVDGAPLVNVFDGATGKVLRTFYAFDQGFRGGVHVAVADVTGDGTPDIIVGAGDGGAPQIEVFDGRTGLLVSSFYAFDPSFRGGVNVAAGDLDGDGRAEVVAGAGFGGAPAVGVFDGVSGKQLASYYAFDPSFRDGVNVAVGDTDGDGIAEVIAGAGEGGAPAVGIFAGLTGEMRSSFYAFGEAFRGGVSVATADVNGDHVDDLIVGTGSGAAAEVRVLNGPDRTLIMDLLPFDQEFEGGVFVG
jgi:hypothetical protein